MHSVDCLTPPFIHSSPVEFHQHVVLEYAENFLSFLVICDLLNQNPNDASAYMLSVLRFGLNMYFLVKKHVFSMFAKLLHIFLFRLIVTF